MFFFPEGYLDLSGKVETSLDRQSRKKLGALSLAVGCVATRLLQIMTSEILSRDVFGC